MTKRGGNTNNPERGSLKTAQKTQTTGRAQPRLLREYRSKAEREAVIQRYLVFGTVALIIGIVVLLFVAFFFDGFVRPRQTVAIVNGQSISVADFEGRVRLERALINDRINSAYQLYRYSFGLSEDQAIQQLQQQPPYSTYLNEIQVPDQLGSRVLNDMVEDELVRQDAATRGIVVGDEEIEKQIRPLFNYDPEADLLPPTATLEPSLTPTPFVSPTPVPTRAPTATPELTPTPSLTPVPSSTPTATPDATQRAVDYTTQRGDYFARLRSQTGASDETIRHYFETLALREALRDAVAVDITDTGIFVNARHILVATESEAQDALAALQSGESFAELARAISTDTGSGSKGGELDWSPASNYVPEFAEAVRTADIGALTGPVQTEFGYHIIQVRAREDRTLTEDQINNAKGQEFSRYLEALRAADTTQVELFDVWTSNVPDDPRFALSR